MQKKPAGNQSSPAGREDNKKSKLNIIIIKAYCTAVLSTSRHHLPSLCSE